MFRHDHLFDCQSLLLIPDTHTGGVTPLGYNAHFKGPFSAFSRRRYSGGSSSGSALAVATGIVPVAIGFDGGGSIRIPCSMSGLHGLAAGFGRIPSESATLSTMIKAGPMTASAHDAALAFAVMAPNKRDHFYSNLYDGGNRGKILFVTLRLFV